MNVRQTEPFPVGSWVNISQAYRRAAGCPHAFYGQILLTPNRGGLLYRVRTNEGYERHFYASELSSIDAPPLAPKLQPPTLEEAKKIVEAAGFEVKPPEPGSVVFDFDYVELEISMRRVDVLADGDFHKTLSEKEVDKLTDALKERQLWRETWLPKS